MKLLRSIFFVVACAAACLGSAAPHLESIDHHIALILVRTPTDSPDLEDSHRDVVLWPTFEGSSGCNRLLSLTSGIDWRGQDADLAFRYDSASQAFVSTNYEAMRVRGYLRAKARWLAGVRVAIYGSPVGAASASPDVLLLGVAEGTDNVLTHSFLEDPGSAQLSIFEAKNWEEQAQIVKRFPYRSITVEYPVDAKRPYAHFFLDGLGWPQGLPIEPSTGVAGLVRARDLLKLALDPESAKWSSKESSVDSASAWFHLVRTFGLPAFLVLAFLTAYVVGCAAYCVMKELRGGIAASLLYAIALAPPTLLVQGAMVRLWGVAFAIPLIFLAGVTVGVVAALSSVGFKKLDNGVHPLLSLAFTGLLTFAALDPKWSLYSGLFGYLSIDQSPESLGLFTLYLAGFCCFAKGSSISLMWMGRVIPLVLALVSLVLPVWWMLGGWQHILIFGVAYLSGEQMLKLPILCLLALIPNSHSDVWHHGVAWYPLGDIANLGEQNALNLGSYAAFFVWPGWFGLACTVAGLYLIGDEFLARQLRVLFHREPRLKGLYFATVGYLAMSLLTPVLLTGVVMIGYGALIATCYAAVRTL